MTAGSRAERDTVESSVLADASVIAALSVYVEPLADGARVLVVEGGDGELATRVEELGARAVHLYDPARGDGALDVRDAAFDLVVIPDVGALEDPAAVVSKLRRVVDPRGALVAMGRARADADADTALDAFPELAPASLGYAELYDLFAVRFEHVSMTGVVPFRGVVFAELGHEDSDVGVSVDTRLADAPPPRVFVVVASREPCPLEPYAIVQVGSEILPRRDIEAEAAFAAMHLKAELLAAQLDEQRARVVAAESQAGNVGPRLERVVAERDAAVVRAAELEAIVVATQQAMAALERRLLVAEQGMLERDDRIAALHAELDARGEGTFDADEVADLVARAERAEAALALHVADLAHVSEAHASETAALEEQLRERARVIGALEKEILRREQLVKELVTSLEEERESGAGAMVFAEPPPMPAAPSPELREENARLRKKLDDLAMDVARREGELRAQAWRITELENAGGGSGASARVTELERELDALRQALKQEHALVERLQNGELGRGG